MAGDPFRDAFRQRLQDHVTTAAIAIPVVDLINTDADPDASAGYVALDFPGAPAEQQDTWGAPGANLHHEQGQVTIIVAAPYGSLAKRDLAEAAAALLRALFRQDRFDTTDGRSVKITATAPMGGGVEEGGLWVETVALAYELYNEG